MAKGIIRQLDIVLKNVNSEIKELASHGPVAAGLSSEGYAGGYRQAISDVILALNGNKPRTRGWWDAIELLEP